MDCFSDLLWRVSLSFATINKIWFSWKINKIWFSWKINTIWFSWKIK